MLIQGAIHAKMATNVGPNVSKLACHCVDRSVQGALRTCKQAFARNHLPQQYMATYSANAMNVVICSNSPARRIYDFQTGINTATIEPFQKQTCEDWSMQVIAYASKNTGWGAR